MYRDPRENIASLIEAWMVGLSKGQFITFRDLPGWPLPGWCFVLPEGWSAMRGKSLAEIAAFQWAACNQAIIQGLSELPKERWAEVSYADLVANPAGTLLRVSEKLNIADRPEHFEINSMRLSRSTVSAPAPNKWRRFEREIESVMPGLSDTIEKLASVASRADL